VLTSVVVPKPKSPRRSTRVEHVPMRRVRPFPSIA
jgi:hypothetical protein